MDGLGDRDEKKIPGESGSWGSPEGWPGWSTSSSKERWEMSKDEEEELCRCVAMNGIGARRR